MEFFGKEAEAALMIKGEEDGKFDKEQFVAYSSFMQKWGQIQYSILQSTLNYYIQTRHELGYDIDYNVNYPEIETTDQILEMINLVGIVVPYGDIYDERDMGITFDCKWDIENRLRLRLLNEQVNEIGYQDVAI